MSQARRWSGSSLKNLVKFYSLKTAKRAMTKFWEMYRKISCKCKLNKHKFKFNVKHRECLRNHPSQRLMTKCLTIPDRIGIWKCWFLRRGENRSTWTKTSRSKKENQQQTQPTYAAGFGNRTRDTSVGGERSHHCAIPAPRYLKKMKLPVVVRYQREHKIYNDSKERD